MNTGIPLLGNAKYPNMPEDWEKGFKTLRSLRADMFFVSHSNQFDMDGRLERWQKDPQTNPFMDPAGYKAYIDQYQKEFEDQLAKEKAGGPVLRGTASAASALPPGRPEVLWFR